MTHLYEISEAYRAVLNNDELEAEELFEALNNMEGMFENKALGIARYIKELEAESEVIGKEIERLQVRKRAIEGRVKGLKVYLSQQMLFVDRKKIADELMTVSVQKSPPTVVVLDEKVIPSEFWKVIPESRNVDKKSILDRFRETETAIPGVEISGNRHHVVIR